MLKRLKARLSATIALLGLPLLLAPLLFLEDGGAAGGGGENAGAGDGAPGGSGEGGAGGEGAGDKGGKITFSAEQQEHVNRLMADAKRKLLAESPDLKDLRAKAKRFDEIEEASKSDLEKERGRAAAAEKKAADATEVSNRRLRRAEIIVAAKDAGAADAGDVFALIEADPTKYEVTVGDDGQVTGATEAVKALLKAKPHLVGKSTSVGSADGGPRGSGGDKPKTLEDAVSRALKT